MLHQRDKYNLISIASLGLAILIGIFAMFSSRFYLIIFSFYLIAASIMSDGLFLNMTFRKAEGLMQFMRGIMLFVLVTYIAFKLI